MGLAVVVADSSSARLALGRQLAREATIRQRIDDLSVVTERANEVDHDVAQAERDLEAIDEAERKELDTWATNGATGPAPTPRLMERAVVQARLAQTKAIAAATRRSATATEPRVEAAQKELQVMVRERPNLIADVLLETATNIAGSYSRHLRGAAKDEQSLLAIRDTAMKIGASGASAAIGELVRKGDRTRWDEPLIARSEIDAIRSRIQFLASRLCGDANADIGD